MGDIMENETRMSKYKELRERVRAEMEIEYSVPQNDNIDDDFLGFMSKCQLGKHFQGKTIRKLVFSAIDILPKPIAVPISKISLQSFLFIVSIKKDKVSSNVIGTLLSFPNFLISLSIFILLVSFMIEMNSHS